MEGQNYSFASCLLQVASRLEGPFIFSQHCVLPKKKKKTSPMLLAKKCFILNVQWTWYTSTLWFTIWQQLEC